MKSFLLALILAAIYSAPALAAAPLTPGKPFSIGPMTLKGDGADHGSEHGGRSPAWSLMYIIYSCCQLAWKGSSGAPPCFAPGTV